MILSVGVINRNRLLAEHVLAGFERSHRGIAMQFGRQADVDHVEVGIGEHRVEVVEPFHARQIDFRPWRSKVAFDPAPIAGQFFPIARADGRHTHAAQPADRPNSESSP